MVDTEDALLIEDLMQLGIQRHRARKISAERFFHDDTRALDETRFPEHPNRCQRRTGWDAQVVQPTAVAAERLFRLFYRCFEDTTTGGQRYIVQTLGKGIPV